MNKLPEAEHAARMELYRQGLSDTEIGERIYLTQPGVVYWRKRNGLPPNRKPRPARLDYARMRQLLDSGLQPKQVAARMGCSGQSVYDLVKRDRAGG